MAEEAEVAVTAVKVEVVVVGKAVVAVEEAEEMAAPAAVEALVSSFLECSLSEGKRKIAP